MKFSDGITVGQLIDYLNENGMGMNTKIMPLGTETKYVRIDRDNKMVILDEVDDEEEEEEDEIMINEEMKSVTVGDEVLVWYDLPYSHKIQKILAPNGIGPKYDIELVHQNRLICKLSTGCIGEKSAEYWLNYWNEHMKRLMFLFNRIDDTNDNILRYSTSLLMDTPRAEYIDEWHKENNNLNMLNAWVSEIINNMSDGVKKAFIAEYGMFMN